MYPEVEIPIITKLKKKEHKEKLKYFKMLLTKNALAKIKCTVFLPLFPLVPGE